MCCTCDFSNQYKIYATSKKKKKKYKYEPWKDMHAHLKIIHQICLIILFSDVGNLQSLMAAWWWSRCFTSKLTPKSSLERKESSILSWIVSKLLSAVACGCWRRMSAIWMITSNQVSKSATCKMCDLILPPTFSFNIKADFNRS